jgi:hypothetical protein
MTDPFIGEQITPAPNDNTDNLSFSSVEDTAGFFEEAYFR